MSNGNRRIKLLSCQPGQLRNFVFHMERPSRLGPELPPNRPTAHIIEQQSKFERFGRDAALSDANIIKRLRPTDPRPDPFARRRQLSMNPFNYAAYAKGYASTSEEAKRLLEQSSAARQHKPDVSPSAAAVDIHRRVSKREQESRLDSARKEAMTNETEEEEEARLLAVVEAARKKKFGEEEYSRINSEREAETKMFQERTRKMRDDAFRSIGSTTLPIKEEPKQGSPSSYQLKPPSAFPQSTEGLKQFYQNSSGWLATVGIQLEENDDPRVEGFIAKLNAYNNDADKYFAPIPEAQRRQAAAESVKPFDAKFTGHNMKMYHRWEDKKMKKMMEKEEQEEDGGPASLPPAKSPRARNVLPVEEIGQEMKRAPRNELVVYKHNPHNVEEEGGGKTAMQRRIDEYNTAKRKADEYLLKEMLPQLGMNKPTQVLYKLVYKHFNLPRKPKMPAIPKPHGRIFKAKVKFAARPRRNIVPRPTVREAEEEIEEEYNKVQKKKKPKKEKKQKKDKKSPKPKAKIASRPRRVIRPTAMSVKEVEEEIDEDYALEQKRAANPMRANKTAGARKAALRQNK